MVTFIVACTEMVYMQHISHMLVGVYIFCAVNQRLASELSTFPSKM